MNLKILSDSELDAAAFIAAKSERAALVDVLKHLAEVDLRKSFSPRFESIHAYVVEYLGYDPKSAWRRVNAMRLMRELPEITPSIADGKLDLTKMVLAQNHFRNEMKENKTSARADASLSFFPDEGRKAPLTKDEKLEILELVKNQTSREAEREFISKSSASDRLEKPDQVNPLAGDKNEVRVTLSDEDLLMIQELKGLLAHKIPNASISEVLSFGLREAITAIKREKSGENRKRRAARKPVGSEAQTEVQFAMDEVTALRAENTRRPSKALKIEVWKRAGGKCELCLSTFALEIDHHVPWARGGKTNLENARLLCRTCNQREAIKEFGRHTIRDQHIEYCA